METSKTVPANIPGGGASHPAFLDPTAERARLYQKSRGFIENSLSENTRRAYESDWSQFVNWCQAMGLSALPASEETVVLYLTKLAEMNYSGSTIQRKKTALGQAHLTANLPSPVDSAAVRKAWRGMRRPQSHGKPPKVRTTQMGKAAITLEELQRMVRALLPNGLIGLRDRALILIGFSGAFRRSEIAMLAYQDVTFVREGVTIDLRWSKTDQEALGRKVALPYGSNIETCPVRTLMDWLEQSGITSGPLFRGFNNGKLKNEPLSDRTVARIVQRTAALVGLDPAKYGGHSLRAGFATAAARAGASERSIMKTTGHRSVTMVRRYIRDGELFNDNAAAKIGL